MQVLSKVEAVPGQYWQWQAASPLPPESQSIYYVKAGDRRVDRPPLLLIHGFGASTDHWRKNVAELSQEFEVWAIGKTRLAIQRRCLARSTTRFHHRSDWPTGGVSR